MPTYTTLETINRVIIDKKIHRWKVLNDENEMMNLQDFSPATPAEDVANTLKIFLESVSGNTFVRIFLFDPKFKSDKGGDTANTVFRYYYKLSPLKADNPLNGFGTGGIGIADYLGLHSQLTEMKTLLAVSQKEREIEDLKKQIKTGKNYSYLETMAESIGKGFYQEMKKKKNGIADDVDDDDDAPAPKKKAAKKNEDAPVAAPVTEKDFAKRSREAIMRLTKVGGLEVVNGLEEMATLAEKEPMKLMNLLNQLKESE